ncbi:unnamed protein product [Amoebophrya sp. A25]|nr:unnamed protein product [Amoebophrya sp. A25]|eukprot:GSA25T00003321001.1
MSSSYQKYQKSSASASTRVGDSRYRSDTDPARERSRTPPRTSQFFTSVEDYYNEVVLRRCIFEQSPSRGGGGPRKSACSPLLILLMGLPGAGKTTLKKGHFGKCVITSIRPDTQFPRNGNVDERNNNYTRRNGRENQHDRRNNSSSSGSEGNYSCEQEGNPHQLQAITSFSSNDTDHINSQQEGGNEDRLQDVQIQEPRQHKFLFDLEPDRLKKYHRDFDDRDADENVHRWSVIKSVELMEKAVRKRVSLIYDCSGSNFRWMEDRARYAFDRGYEVDVIYVDTPLPVCLYRNRLRGLNLTPRDVTEALLRRPDMRARAAIRDKSKGSSSSASSSGESAKNKKPSTTDQQDNYNPRGRDRRTGSDRGRRAQEEERDEEQNGGEDHRKNKTTCSRERDNLSVVQLAEDEQEEHPPLEEDDDACSQVDDDGFGGEEIAFDEGHFVPEEIILEKAEVISDSFRRLQRCRYVRRVVRECWEGEEDARPTTVVQEEDEGIQDHDPRTHAKNLRDQRKQLQGNKQLEMRRALIDLFCYPAPRFETVSPVDPLYGVPPNGACPADVKDPCARRTLRMALWKRDLRVAERKKHRLGWMDSELESRESYIWRTVFGCKDGKRPRPVRRRDHIREALQLHHHQHQDVNAARKSSRDHNYNTRRTTSKEDLQHGPRGDHTRSTTRGDRSSYDYNPGSRSCHGRGRGGRGGGYNKNNLQSSRAGAGAYTYTSSSSSSSSCAASDRRNNGALYNLHEQQRENNRDVVDDRRINFRDISRRGNNTHYQNNGRGYHVQDGPPHIKRRRYQQDSSPSSTIDRRTSNHHNCSSHDRNRHYNNNNNSNNRGRNQHQLQRPEAPTAPAWVMERNMFPYQMPDGCQHWTLWAQEELAHDSICRIVEEWIQQNEDSLAVALEQDGKGQNNFHQINQEDGDQEERFGRSRRQAGNGNLSDSSCCSDNNYSMSRDDQEGRSNNTSINSTSIDNQKKKMKVISWNYDDNNARRTIDIPHVHVYLNFGKVTDVNDGRVPLREMLLDRNMQPPSRTSSR